MNNKKIIIAIIEDQIENIDVLSIFLKQYSDAIHIKYIGNTGDEARNILINKDIDLAFLDIDLVEETIFDVLNSIDYSHLNDSLIFVTAHGTFENALNAIRYSCLNFITKPIDYQILQNTIDQVLSKSQQSEFSRIQALLDLFKSDKSATKRIGICLPNGIIQFEDCDDILYITANNTITNITLKENTITSVKHLGYYRKLFLESKDFLLIHKSTIINLNHIKRLNVKKRIITMINNEELFVSRRLLPNLQKVIK